MTTPVTLNDSLCSGKCLEIRNVDDSFVAETSVAPAGIPRHMYIKDIDDFWFSISYFL